MVTSYKIERNVFGYSTVLMKIKTLFYIEEIRFYPTEELTLKIIINGQNQPLPYKKQNYEMFS